MMIITKRRCTAWRFRALEAGAEDYVVKPFSPTELVARELAALRRRAEPAPFVLDELAIDDARWPAYIINEPRVGCQMLQPGEVA